MNYPLGPKPIELTEKQLLVKTNPKLPWWFRVDWTLSDKEIARQVHKPQKLVYERRWFLDVPPAVKWTEKRKEWASLDWSKDDTALAKEQGCTRMNVYLWRQRLERDNHRLAKQLRKSFRYSKKRYRFHRDHVAAAARLQADPSDKQVVSAY